MKSFFRSVKQTFSSRQFYQHSLHQSGWKAIKLLAKTSCAIAVLIGFIGAITFLIFAPSLRGKLTEYVVGVYPEDLVVTVEQGLLTTNSETPVAFPLPGDTTDDNGDEYPVNLLVLAPNEDSDPALLATYDTFAVATARTIVAGTADQIRVYPYGNESMVLTKTSLLEKVDHFSRFATVGIAIAIIPFAFILVLSFVIGHLFWLLIVSLFLWVVFRIRKQMFTYKQVYALGIYALVPLIILEIALVPLGIDGKLFTFVFVSVVVLAAMHSYKIAGTTEIEQ